MVLLASPPFDVASLNGLLLPERVPHGTALGERRDTVSPAPVLSDKGLNGTVRQIVPEVGRTQSRKTLLSSIPVVDPGPKNSDFSPFGQIRVDVRLPASLVHNHDQVRAGHIGFVIEPGDVVLVLEPYLELVSREVPCALNVRSAEHVPIATLPLPASDRTLKQQPAVQSLCRCS